MKRRINRWLDIISKNLIFFIFIIINLSQIASAVTIEKLCEGSVNIVRTLSKFVDARDKSNIIQAIAPRGFSHKLLKDSPLFNLFLRQSGKTWAFGQKQFFSANQLPPEQRATISAYIDFIIDFFGRNEGIEELQNQALLDNLRHHGADIKSDNAELALSRISSSNIKRILKTDHIDLNQFSPEIQDIILTIELYFTHNSGSLPSNSSTNSPILSSQQIVNVGGRGGQHSDHPFNTDILRSDDQVHFHVHLVNKYSDLIFRENKYGKGGLQRTYSQGDIKFGWISTFIMNVEDIWGIKAFLPLEKPSRGSMDWSNPEVLEMTRLIHIYDFTIANFLLFIRYQLGRVLSSLDPDGREYNEIKLTILNRNINLIQSILNEYVYGKLNIPNNYEFKVPVRYLLYPQ